MNRWLKKISALGNRGMRNSKNPFDTESFSRAVLLGSFRIQFHPSVGIPRKINPGFVRLISATCLAIWKRHFNCNFLRAASPPRQRKFNFSLCIVRTRRTPPPWHKTAERENGRKSDTACTKGALHLGANATMESAANFVAPELGMCGCLALLLSPTACKIATAIRLILIGAHAALTKKKR